MAAISIHINPELVKVKRSDAKEDMVGMMPFDSDLLWRMRKGNRETVFGPIEINNLGMRSTKQNDNFHGNILFLGDSSTFGFGVRDEDTYVNLSSKCLKMNAHNGGVPGYTSTQSKFQLNELLESLKVNVVVIASLWSDIMQSKWSDQELQLLKQLQESRSSNPRESWLQSARL